MRRYWIEPENIVDGEVVLHGDLFHHVCVVCRQEVGSRFEVLREGGQAMLVEVIHRDKKSARARILKERQLPPLGEPRIHLCLSLPRFSKVDWIVEKSVELGVYAIKPFVSDHSFVSQVDGVPEGKWRRWEKLVVAASQQSARGDVMILSKVKTLAELLNEFNQQTKVAGLFPYEGASKRALKDALLELKSGPLFTDLWVFVGSEGGFSPQDVESFAAHGLQPVTMGAQVLRVETACVALAAILKYEFDLMALAREDSDGRL